ncbi:MAG: NAD-binding protein [Solirubrobacterales bacterium]|nr:NAD-binding protein [Solirubrobacterales bacterium]
MPARTSPAARIRPAEHGPAQRTLRSARLTWRRRVKPRWHDVRPPALLALGITVLVLGTIGFSEVTVQTARGVLIHYGFWDSLYRAITLFVFGGSVTPPIPLALQIARIIAPVLTGYAAVGTILALSREQARVLGIRLLVRRHVIVAGLGTSGARLAQALVDHEPVVVIESNPIAELIPTARARGVRVLIGSATDELMLRRAGIRNARTLVALSGRDGANVDIAAAAARARQRDPERLTIFAHLRDLDLWRSLAAEGASFEPRQAGARLEYFNVFATGAQLLLERHPPFIARPVPDGEPWEAHLLMVGIEGVGEQIVLQIARLWSSLSRDRDRLRITLAGPHAERDLQALRDRYPALDRYCSLVAHELAIESARFQGGAAMVVPDGGCEVIHAYVCLLDEGDALLAALALHARPATAHIPVAVALDDEREGIAIVLNSEEGRFQCISAFGVISNATSDALLLRGTNELLARAQHAQWLRNERAKGLTAADNEFLVAWEELPEHQREDNRKFADDLHFKLNLIGTMLVPMPLRDPAEAPFEFTGQELELLAEHEHTRWMNARVAAGWRHGPSTDRKHKISADIKPWSELSEPTREKDRNAVRELPDMLALAGFRIERAGATAAPRALGRPAAGGTRSGSSPAGAAAKTVHRSHTARTPPARD